MYPLMPGTIIKDWQFSSAADITDTSAVEVAAAPGADKRNYVTGVHFANSATAVGTAVRVLSGSTVIWNGFVGPFVVAAPGSSVDGDQFVKPLKGGVNEAITVVCGTTASATRASVQGFVAIG